MEEYKIFKEEDEQTEEFTLVQSKNLLKNKNIVKEAAECVLTFNAKSYEDASLIYEDYLAKN